MCSRRMFTLGWDIVSIIYNTLENRMRMRVTAGVELLKGKTKPEPKHPSVLRD